MSFIFNNVMTFYHYLTHFVSMIPFISMLSSTLRHLLQNTEYWKTLKQMGTFSQYGLINIFITTNITVVVITASSVFLKKDINANLFMEIMTLWLYTLPSYFPWFIVWPYFLQFFHFRVLHFLHHFYQAPLNFFETTEKGLW